jgi:tRNA modification GTPase
VIYFKSPKSYTGEDLLELHLHGGTAIIQSVLKAIKELHDPSSDIQIRYAENGEFSRRAFINGRFDLTEIEGIREMIDAETETQRIAALSSLTGNTKNLFQTWRDEIINNVALLTTVIDFGEEHDVEEVAELFDKVDGNINKLQQQIEQYLIKVRRSEILVKGVKLILLGPPNAGKSSLLNYLANKDAAIVSDIAGTTRDVIDVPLDISGYKVVVGDTAGIRGTDMADSIEREGIRRAKDKSLTGDLVIAVLPVNSTQGYDELFGHISFLQKEGKEIIVVLNKQDLLTEQVTHSSTASKSYTAVEVATKYSQQLDIPVENFHVVSCITGYGMADLTNTLVENFKSISLSDSTDPIIVSSRVQDLIENDVLHGLEQFRLWKAQDDVVLATESLKQSVEGIGKISGHAIGVEEILGVVFSKFCIGK